LATPATRRSARRRRNLRRGGRSLANSRLSGRVRNRRRRPGAARHWHETSRNVAGAEVRQFRRPGILLRRTGIDALNFGAALPARRSAGKRQQPVIHDMVTGSSTIKPARTSPLTGDGLRIRPNCMRGSQPCVSNSSAIQVNERQRFPYASRIQALPLEPGMPVL
jgi:hypothetical protein